jgi:hypothetical protein
VLEPVPDACVYQSKFVPIAVNAGAVTPWQYCKGVLTVGATGL